MTPAWKPRYAYTVRWGFVSNGKPLDPPNEQGWHTEVDAMKFGAQVLDAKWDDPEFSWIRVSRSDRDLTVWRWDRPHSEEAEPMVGAQAA